MGHPEELRGARVDRPPGRMIRVAPGVLNMGAGVFGGQKDRRFSLRRAAASICCFLLTAAISACAPLGDDESPGVQLATIQPMPAQAAPPAITEAALTTTDAL